MHIEVGANLPQRSLQLVCCAGWGEAWLGKFDYTSRPRWKGWVPVFERALRGKDAGVLWRAGEFGVLEPASGRM